MQHVQHELGQISSMLAVLPDLMTRAAKEPVTPFEPPSSFSNARLSSQIERCVACYLLQSHVACCMFGCMLLHFACLRYLHYCIIPLYGLGWAISAAAYMSSGPQW